MVAVELVVSTIGLLHSVLAVAAMIAGAAMLLREKGSRSHRRIGWFYVAMMVGLNVTALMIYRLSGRFGPFHAAAIVSLATVLAGYVVVLRRRHYSDWLRKHYLWMTYSYVVSSPRQGRKSSRACRLLHSGGQLHSRRHSCSLPGRS